MKATVIRENLQDAPDYILELGYSRESKLNILLNSVHEVYAIVVFKGVSFLLIVDKYDMPAWLPSILFEMTLSPVNPEWICTLHNSETSLILGPEYIAGSIAAYESMVELAPESVAHFWSKAV